MWEVNGTVDDNCPNIQKPRYFTWLAWISQKANGWAENLTVMAPSPCPCMVHKVHHKVVPVLRPYLPSAFMSRAAGPVGRWWDEIITACFALWPKPSKKGCFGLLSTPPPTHTYTHLPLSCLSTVPHLASKGLDREILGSMKRWCVGIMATKWF